MAVVRGTGEPSIRFGWSWLRWCRPCSVSQGLRIVSTPGEWQKMKKYTWNVFPMVYLLSCGGAMGGTTGAAVVMRPVRYILV